MTENDARDLFNRATEERTSPVIHVRVQGRSRDVALDMLDIGQGSSDEAVRESLARFLELDPALFKDTVIERHENGNMTLRPEALFGK